MKENNTKSLSLAGRWRCKLDPNDVGIKENWSDSTFLTTVQLPGTTTTNKLGKKSKEADQGQLTPTYRYQGVAWYQRVIEIPKEWSDKQIFFFIERVIMRSSVWINGKQVGDSVNLLGAPHKHLLGPLSPGEHIITVRIDNRNVLDVSLGNGHHFYDGMQTVWNGMVGRIELIAKPMVYLDLVRLFPSYKNGEVGIEVTLQNFLGYTKSYPLNVIIRENKTGDVVAKNKFEITAKQNCSISKYKVKLNKSPMPWDEFQPNLYQVEVTLGLGNTSDTYHANIGFRDLGSTRHHLTINSRPFFYRNSHDGCMFPLTGYPPTDVESWRKILKTYKKHGLNGIRFHSWTPPEAAFVAADELGIYIQSEHFWNQMDATDEMASFAKQEMLTTLNAYGNHPSNCFVLYGNELGGDLNLYAKWLEGIRLYDPRHLYSVAAGRRVRGDDFWEYGVKMNWATPHTNWDYNEYFEKSDLPHVPEITHELGQPVTHPDWKEIEKYTGVLKPLNYELFRDAAVLAGVEEQSAEFQKASGNINRINYKYDIEALLRTSKSAGYNLLDMHDYPGQGAALVGWLDAFYQEKGFLSADEFSQYGSATVPLARLPKFIFTDGDTLHAKAEIAHYGAEMLPNAELHWVLKCDSTNKVFASGKLPKVKVPVGTVTKMGEIICPLKTFSARGMHYILEFRIANSSYFNSWDIWVFPKSDKQAKSHDIIITSNADTAVQKLNEGCKVLLLANQLGADSLGALACFKPPFWSTNYSFGQQSNVSGAVVHNKHPALALFPTDDVIDWQWQPLCADALDYDDFPNIAWRDLPPIVNPNARGFILKEFPANYRPIVQSVPDFQRPVKIGTIFEVKNKYGGRLMVCGYDIDSDLKSRPVARQLRKSLLKYMMSSSFKPNYIVDNEWVLSTFKDSEKTKSMPEGYENALIYIKAGAKLPTKNNNFLWSEEYDALIHNLNQVEYTVRDATVWGNGLVTGWVGEKIHVKINIKEAIGGILKVRFHDWSNLNRRGVIHSEDGQQQKLGPHEEGVWIEFPLRREDSLDGEIILQADVTHGPDLIITDLVIVPR